MLRRSFSSSRNAGGSASAASTPAPPKATRSSRRRSVGGVALPEQPAKQIVEQLKDEKLLGFRVDAFLVLSSYVLHHPWLLPGNRWPRKCRPFIKFVTLAFL